MMHFLLMFNCFGKLRLEKWFSPLTDREKKLIWDTIKIMVLSRQTDRRRACNFVQWRDLRVVYNRYASLYFCAGIEDQDNELLTLEVLDRYVRLLDKYYGNVCELDIMFDFQKAHFVLDEFLMGGEILETSMVDVVRSLRNADTLQEPGDEYFST